MFKQEKPENLAGADKNHVLRVTFDSRLKLEFHGAKVTPTLSTKSRQGHYKPTEEFTPNDVVVLHCCQSLEIVDNKSEETFGIAGQ
jgi:hypothetical protein